MLKFDILKKNTDTSVFNIYFVIETLLNFLFSILRRMVYTWW